jgi:O-antigen/teichoic acid export membrane protein
LLPVIFTKLDPHMVATARFMLIWIGGALVLGLPFSAFFGVFVGLQRNDIPAMISLVSKGGLGIALILVAHYTHDLILASEVYCGVTLIGHALHLIFFKIICPDWRIRLGTDLPSARKEVVSYCLSLSVWSLATLLINGVSASIVSIFAFKQVAALGVALNAVAFFSGTFRSFQSPILQIFAKYNAREEKQNLLVLFNSVSEATSILILIMCCWLILPARPIFILWVGPQIAPLSTVIFIIMVSASTTRNFASAYATYLLALGEQRKVYISPFAEGLANFLSSLLLAKYYGAIGVAGGACVGAVVGVSAHFVYNFKRTMPADFDKWRYFRIAILEPLLFTLPMVLVITLEYAFRISWFLAVPAMILATTPALIRAWRVYGKAKAYLSSDPVNGINSVGGELQEAG